jgi:uncharacterized membrane protein (UPF0182 family)
MRLPNEPQESYLILQPFVPFSQNDSRKDLAAFMIAKSDPNDYGKLETFVMPRGNLPDGPSIVAATMQQDTQVSQLQTLLGQQGSELKYGNLIMVPINNSLLYVRPVYTIATSTAVPTLKKVIAEYNGKVAVEDSLQTALTDLFGQAPSTGETQPGTLPTGNNPPPPPTSTTPKSVADLLAKAQKSFDDADKALKSGDLETYAKDEKQGRDYVKQAQDASASSSGSGSGSTTTTTTTPATTSTTSGTA